MGYFKSTVKGLGWIGGLRGFARVVTILKLAILARLLAPADFGLFGITALVLAFLEIITETGINVFLLQHKGDWEKYIDSAWIVSIARGILISVVIFSVSPYIALFFSNKNLTQLLYVTALIPFIRGFINPAIIRFQKDLEFSKEFFFRFALIGIEFIVTCFLAYIFRSSISLIISMVISACFEVTLTFVLISPRPKLVFDWPKSKEVINKGKWVTGFGIFNYFFTQGDDIAVAKLLGEIPLGIYQNAYKLSTLPMSEVNDIFYKVTFPVYSKLSENPDRLKRAVIKQVVSTSAILGLVGLILFIYSREIVLIVLGPNWVAASGVVKILAFLGTIRGITFSFNSLFLALEKQRYVTYITLSSLVGMLSVLIPLTEKFGVVGAASAAMFGSIITLPLAIYLMRKVFRSL